MSDLEKMIGQTLISVSGFEKGSERIELRSSDRNKLVLWHERDCCENVSVEQVDGDPDDLIDSPLLMCEEISGETLGADPNRDPDGKVERGRGDSTFTWTYYKFATVKGYVTVRWFGSSNGYYAEDVDVWHGPVDAEPSLY